MPKMMGRNLRPGVCSCLDCGGPASEDRGRAWEKKEWMREAAEESRIIYDDSLDPRDWDM